MGGSTIYLAVFFSLFDVELCKLETRAGSLVIN